MTYKGEELGKQRLDVVVDDCIVIEIKSTHDLQKNATRQLFNYLRATKLTAGMLFHFGPVPTFFEFHRLISDRSPFWMPGRQRGIIPGAEGRHPGRGMRDMRDIQQIADR